MKLFILQSISLSNPLIKTNETDYNKYKYFNFIIVNISHQSNVFVANTSVKR